jgi:acetyltransferase-like isoleucine patch superfamily enzyme
MKKLCASFKRSGKDIFVGANCLIEGEQNISIGNHVFIGERCVLMTTEAQLIIGDYVMFAPEVSIITGNHRIDEIGEYMINVKSKKWSDDCDVIIEDDVWVGLRAIILKGVRIGRGSVISAGAVVISDVPAYTIYYSKEKMRKRFSESEIAEHKRQLASKYAMADNNSPKQSD